MSWPGTDREVEIEQELQALRRVRDHARKVITLFGADGLGPKFTDLWIALQVVRGLKEALDALPKEEST